MGEQVLSVDAARSLSCPSLFHAGIQVQWLPMAERVPAIDSMTHCLLL
jgi:hypothetical protein